MAAEKQQHEDEICRAQAQLGVAHSRVQALEGQVEALLEAQACDGAALALAEQVRHV